MRIIRTIILVSLSIVTSCSSIENSLIKSQHNDSNLCYVIKNMSFLYSLNYCTGEENNCAGVQAFGVQSNMEDLNRKFIPDDEKSLKINKSVWEEKIKKVANIGGTKGSRIIGIVEQNTKIKITGHYYVNDTTIGNFWYVQGVIKDGAQKGLVIEFSSPYHLLPPIWVNTKDKSEGPIFNSKFLSKCN